VVSLRAVPLLLLFKNIWFRNEAPDSLDGKKDENGKSLSEEEGDSNEEKGDDDDEGEREESIANGPNNWINSDRLKPPVEFLEKLSNSARPVIELSLFSREFPILKDG